MPSLDTISGWFKYSQIEYFTPFMKLWLAFNSWYKQFHPNLNTDREAINLLKNDGPVKNSFVNLIDSNSDDGKEIRTGLAILVNEIRISSLVDERGHATGFTDSDTLPSFRILNEKAQKNKLKKGGLISLDKETVVTDNKSIFFQEILEIIYQIRCALIHGDFGIEDRRANRLVKSAYIILNLILKPIITGVHE